MHSTLASVVIAAVGMICRLPSSGLFPAADSLHRTDDLAGAFAALVAFEVIQVEEVSSLVGVAVHHPPIVSDSLNPAECPVVTIHCYFVRGNPTNNQRDILNPGTAEVAAVDDAVAPQPFAVAP